MALVWITNNRDLPSLYSKVNLAFATFDCVLYWLWGDSIFSIIAWIGFSLYVLRVVIGYVLYKGVLERNLLKCKIFCFAEFALVCLMLLGVILHFPSIAHLIWGLVVLAIRLYGIWIIGGFVRGLQAEAGANVSFPWFYFPEPVVVQDKNNVSPGHQIPPV